MVRFMKWLKETIGKEPITEAGAAAHLDKLRRDTSECLDLSFPTIAGYGFHGAIIHYAVTKESDIPLDYLHGTGHGIGHLLNVHEGPNNFHWKLRAGAEPVALEPGMITTDEPGVYIAGSHGIRLENELLCCEIENTEYGKFLGFDCLTLAPLDLDAIDADLLTWEDKQRLNEYHKRVYELLAPELDEEERD